MRYENHNIFIIFIKQIRNVIKQLMLDMIKYERHHNYTSLICYILNMASDHFPIRSKKAVNILTEQKHTVNILKQNYFDLIKCQIKDTIAKILFNDLESLLLTWFNFNPSMDK